MPTVPRGERQVALQPIRGGRRTAAPTALSEGAGLAEARAEKFKALGQLGGAVARTGIDLYGEMVAEEKKRADEAFALKVKNRLSAFQSSEVYDPQRGALTVQGENALVVREGVRQKWDTVVGELGKEAVGDRQKAIVDRIVGQEWESLDLTLQRHAASEYATFRQETFRDRLTNGVQDAQRQFLDPRLVAQGITDLVADIRRTGPGLGMTPDTVERQAREVTSKVHVGVVRNLVGQDKDKAAREYLTAVKEQIDPEALDDLTKLVQAGSDKAAAQALSDAVLKEGGTLDQQREKVKARAESPEVRDAALAYIEHEAVVQDRVERDRIETRDKGILNLLDKTKDWRRIPTDVWQSLDENHRTSFMAYAKRLAEGVDVKTNPVKFERLYRLADEHPEEFTKLILSDPKLGYLGSLSREDFQEMVRLQARVRAEGKRVVEKELAPARTRAAVYDTTIKAAGIKPDTPEEAALSERYLEEVRAAQVREGRELNEVELQQTLKRLVVQSVTDPGRFVFFGGTRKRGYAVTIADVPAADRNRITKARMRMGKTLEERDIVNDWLDEQAESQRK